MAAAEEKIRATIKEKFECNICKKIFESLPIMNYHILLEHSDLNGHQQGLDNGYSNGSVRFLKGAVLAGHRQLR